MCSSNLSHKYWVMTEMLYRLKRTSLFRQIVKILLDWPWFTTTVPFNNGQAPKADIIKFYSCNYFVNIYLQLCDDDIVSQGSGKTPKLMSHREKTACLSDKHLGVDSLWFKVMRTPVSPELVWTSYNVAVSLHCILWNVSLNLSRISSFKRSWELLTGVSTCL